MTKEEVIKKIDEALKQFGEYDYYDKGAHEILNVGEIVDKIVDKYKTPQKIAKFLKEVYKEDERKTEPFIFEAVFDIIERKLNNPQKQEFIDLEFVQNFYEEETPPGGIVVPGILAIDLFGLPDE